MPLLGGRWCYLAPWRNTSSQHVVDWHLVAQIPTDLVLTALEQTLTLCQPTSGLIIHANRGSQYTSTACRARIAQAGAKRWVVGRPFAWLVCFRRLAIDYDFAPASYET